MNIEQYNKIRAVEEIFKKWNDKFAFFGMYLGQTNAGEIVLEVDDTLIPSKELLHEEVNRKIFSFDKWIEEKEKLQQVYALQSDEVIRVIKESKYQELKVIDEVSRVRLTPCPDVLRVTRLIEEYAEKGNTLKDFFKNMSITYYRVYGKHNHTIPSLKECDEQNHFLKIDEIFAEESFLESLYNISEEKISKVYKLFRRVDLYYKEVEDFVQRFEKIGETLLIKTTEVYGIHKNKKAFRSILKKYYE